MNKSLKLFGVSTAACSLIAVAALSASNSMSFKATADVDVTWGHYSAVEPGLDTAGCNEFWISCETHEVTLSQPSSGTIIDRGAPSQDDIDSWKDFDDGRYIPQYKIDDTHIRYGIYPQTHVSDASLVNELNKLTTKNSCGYYLYGRTYYYKTVATPYSSSDKFNDGTSITENSAYWFSCDPISWKIVSSSDGTYFLTTEKLLDISQYYTESLSTSKSRKTDYEGNVASVYNNNYKYSALRTFLNTTFYNNAFCIESDAILTTEVDNEASTNKYGCENTNDKVFALSYSEASNLSSKASTVTDYAKAIGGVNYYYTRTPVSYPYYAYYVNSSGSFDCYIYSSPTSSNYSVRAAIHLYIS